PELLKLEGMTTQLAAKLAESGVKKRDDLADLAVDELSEMTGMESEAAKKLRSRLKRQPLNGPDERRPIRERAEGPAFGAARAAARRRRGEARPGRLAHRVGQVAPARVPAQDA